MKLIRHSAFPMDHYVLVDETNAMPPERLVVIARRCARRLALQSTGDSRNFTLIHNGPGLARRQCAHVHIVCACGRRKKALILLFIGLRGVWRSFASDIADAGRQAG
jgi:hypothetical protein